MTGSTNKSGQQVAKEALQAFVEFLEREIYEQPFNWLWSHKRWKHRKPERAISIER